MCRLLRIFDVCKMRHRFTERLFKSFYNQLLNSHDSETSHIAKYGYTLATRLHGQWLIEDDLNTRSAKYTNKSTLVARGADTQLGSSYVLAPLATNVGLWNPINVFNL